MDITISEISENTFAVMANGYSFLVDKPSRLSLWTARGVCGEAIVRCASKDEAIERAARIFGE